MWCPPVPEANKGDPAMEAAAKTWNGEFWKKTGGGGGPWDSITFDAELNRIYVGTANASPYDPEARSPGGGDNLYTASIVALDADTGNTSGTTRSIRVTAGTTTPRSR
jgi:quinohemoprotein ethanol dehydrogenase